MVVCSTLGLNKLWLSDFTRLHGQPRDGHHRTLELATMLSADRAAIHSGDENTACQAIHSAYLALQLSWPPQRHIACYARLISRSTSKACAHMAKSAFLALSPAPVYNRVMLSAV